jgi:acyl-CoA carboxylase epsilon subunit
MSNVDEGQAPAVTVLRGRPTPAELAAVLAVLLAVRSAAAAVAPADREPPPAWADRARLLRAVPRPGPHAWRAAALPR